jgi:hypothetical protein
MSATLITQQHAVIQYNLWCRLCNMELIFNLCYDLILIST